MSPTRRSGGVNPPSGIRAKSHMSSWRSRISKPASNTNPRVGLTILFGGSDAPSWSRRHVVANAACRCPRGPSVRRGCIMSALLLRDEVDLESSKTRMRQAGCADRARIDHPARRAGFVKESGRDNAAILRRRLAVGRSLHGIEEGLALYLC